MIVFSISVFQIMIMNKSNGYSEFVKKLDPRWHLASSPFCSCKCRTHHGEIDTVKPLGKIRFSSSFPKTHQNEGVGKCSVYLAKLNTAVS